MTEFVHSTDGPTQTLEWHTTKLTVFVGDATDAAVAIRTRGFSNVPQIVGELIGRFDHRWFTCMTPSNQGMKHIQEVEIDPKLLVAIMATARVKGCHNQQALLRGILDHIFLNGTFSVAA